MPHGNGTVSALRHGVNAGTGALNSLVHIVEILSSPVHTCIAL